MKLKPKFGDVLFVVPEEHRAALIRLDVEARAAQAAVEHLAQVAYQAQARLWNAIFELADAAGRPEIGANTTRTYAFRHDTGEIVDRGPMASPDEIPWRTLFRAVLGVEEAGAPSHAIRERPAKGVANWHPPLAAGDQVRLGAQVGEIVDAAGVLAVRWEDGSTCRLTDALADSIIRLPHVPKPASSRAAAVPPPELMFSGLQPDDPIPVSAKIYASGAEVPLTPGATVEFRATSTNPAPTATIIRSAEGYLGLVWPGGRVEVLTVGLAAKIVRVLAPGKPTPRDSSEPKAALTFFGLPPDTPIPTTMRIYVDPSAHDTPLSPDDVVVFHSAQAGLAGSRATTATVVEIGQHLGLSWADGAMEILTAGVAAKIASVRVSAKSP